MQLIYHIWMGFQSPGCHNFVYSSYFATAPFLGIERCAPNANFAWKTAIIAGPVYKAFPILYVWIEQ